MTSSLRSFAVPAFVRSAMPLTFLLATVPLANAHGAHARRLLDDEGRVAGWRGDIEVLVERAQREHASPARPAFSAPFVEGARDLATSVGEKSDGEVLFEVMRLVALLGDGHSSIFGPAADSPLDVDQRLLPVTMHLFAEGVFIVDGEGAGADLAGCRVSRIGGVDVEELLRRLAPSRGMDNEHTWTWLGPRHYLPRASMLRVAGAELSGDAAVLDVVTPEGDELEVELGLSPTFRPLRRLGPSPATFGDAPLYLRDVGTNFWIEPLDDKTLYVQFNQVRDTALESIALFARRLRETLQQDDPRTLIVDVRHNSGGNNTLLRPLVRTLIEFDMRASENELLVLMGRNTFSACQNFINRVERWTDAVFLGEPSSSCPNFVGETNEFTLPYSRLQGSISNRFWQDSDPFDTRAWIVPDVAVPVTAAAYFGGDDPTLDAAIGYAAERAATHSR